MNGALVPHVPATLVDRLAKVAGLLSSDLAGERSAAAFRATAIIREAGLTWAEVIRAAGPRQAERPVIEPDGSADWNTRVHECLNHRGVLTPWERQFLLSLAALGAGRCLSDKQIGVLATIYAKVVGQ